MKQPERERQPSIEGRPDHPLSDPAKQAEASDHPSHENTEDELIKRQIDSWQIDTEVQAYMHASARRRDELRN